MTNRSIRRLTTAYKDIFTTVYLLEAPEGCILFDAASYPEDIDSAVLPFLQEAGITAAKLKYVFISHNHKDHSGGLERLMEHFPDCCIVSRSDSLAEKFRAFRFLKPEDGQLLLGTYRVVTIPGHTQDSSALLDLRTGTLITGDCLQQYGIRGSGDWASNISYPEEHLRAIGKVRTLAPQAIFTAHDYVPYGYRAESPQQAAQMLDACAEPLYRLKQLILDNPEADDAQIRALFSDEENHLTVNTRVVAAMRGAVLPS